MNNTVTIDELMEEQMRLANELAFAKKTQAKTKHLEKQMDIIHLALIGLTYKIGSAVDKGRG